MRRNLSTLTICNFHPLGNKVWQTVVPRTKQQVKQLRAANVKTTRSTGKRVKVAIEKSGNRRIAFDLRATNTINFVISCRQLAGKFITTSC